MILYKSDSVLLYIVLLYSVLIYSDILYRFIIINVHGSHILLCIWRQKLRRLLSVLTAVIVQLIVGS